VEALVALLEVWELPAASNFLLLSSVLRQVRDVYATRGVRKSLCQTNRCTYDHV
jgi:hypothetical protein